MNFDRDLRSLKFCASIANDCLMLAQTGRFTYLRHELIKKIEIFFPTKLLLSFYSAKVAFDSTIYFVQKFFIC